MPFLLTWVRNAEWESHDGECIEVPGAPKMKDLDSFTEGTGKGSFDSIPAASTNEFGEPIQGPNALSLELLPVADPNLSVELWRKEVCTDGVTEPFPVSDTEDVVVFLDFDDINSLSEMTLMSPNPRFVEPPRMTSGIATSASNEAIHPVYPHIKRARSSSPDFARRIRPRSQSLISVRSASAFHTAVDLACTPLVLSGPRFLPRVTAEPPD